MRGIGFGSGVTGRSLTVTARIGVIAARIGVCLFAWAASAQVSITVIDAAGERPLPAVCDLGGVSPDELASARFKVKNATDAPALVSLLSVGGAGFALAGAPAIPAAIPAQQAIEFGVEFRGTAVAGYSAELIVNDTRALLIASVLPRLTYPAAAPEFGAVEAGSTVAKRVVVRNLTGMLLGAPRVSVEGDAFSLAAADDFEFDVAFRPPGAGTWTGTLAIDGRTYRLSGTGVALPLPTPMLSIELPEARSGAQGTVSVAFDAPARTSGAGVLTLDFDGPADPAIQLGVVGRSLPFTVAPGDARARFGDLDAVAFQTGTTAGTIGITVEMGGATARKTVVIPPAPVAIVSAEATRTAGAIEVRIGGFDNTRTAGAIAYTFFDGTGAALATIPVDSRTEFASYFAQSDLGGRFELRSVFPVSGDASRIAGFAVQMVNSAGTTTTGRLKF